MPDPQPCSENQAVGLDLGVAHYCVLSIGTLVENPRHFLRHERQLRLANRSLARKKKGSNCWKKQVKRLACLHHTFRNARRDFQHKVSTQIARMFSTVYVEELNIQGMVRNSRISQSIQDCGWSTFIGLLSYKTIVVKVNSRHTSQTCQVCGRVDRERRVSRSTFVCRCCGHTDHADVNAAKNILSRGAALVRKREAVACA